MVLQTPQTESGHQTMSRHVFTTRAAASFPAVRGGGPTFSTKRISFISGWSAFRHEYKSKKMNFQTFSWNYESQSAFHVFGDFCKDKTAETVIGFMFNPASRIGMLFAEAGLECSAPGES